MLPVKRIALPVAGAFQFNTLGFEQAIEAVDFAELPVDVLARQLREVYDGDRAEIEQLGRAASVAVHGGFSTEASVAAAVERLGSMPADHSPRRLRSAAYRS